MRWSGRHPYAVDLRSARATPAPPVAMVGYSARLALSTTLTASFFSALAHLPDPRTCVVFAVPFLCWSGHRLLLARRAWCDPVERAPGRQRPSRPEPVDAACIRGIHTRYPLAAGAGAHGREARMSVKQALLALLEEGPRYGYQLRAEFEERTGATWPLNVGQVYTTLTRLERDGLVEGAGRRRRGPRRLPDHRGRPRRGRRPGSRRRSARTQPPRDELAIKLALAVTVPGVDVGRVIQPQRTATMTALQDYTRLKRRADRGPAARGPGLAAGPRLAGLRGRGRDPLARPLRGAAAPGGSSSGRRPLLGARPTRSPTTGRGGQPMSAGAAR